MEHVGRERGISRRIYNRAKETRGREGVPRFRGNVPRLPHLVSFKHLLSADDPSTCIRMSKAHHEWINRSARGRGAVIYERVESRRLFEPRGIQGVAGFKRCYASVLNKRERNVV